MNLSVVSPDGSGHGVRLTPHTTVNQILREVCAKTGLPADNFSLRYEGKQLENGCRLHYAGLVDGTVLEMAEISGAESGAISVSLEVNCLRFVGSFMPDDNLMSVVRALCPAGVLERENSFPAVAVSQQKIVGVQKLQQTTFGALGINGGKVLLRMEMRDADAVGGRAGGATARPARSSHQVANKKPKQAHQNRTEDDGFDGNDEPTPKDEDKGRCCSGLPAVDDFPYLGERNMMVFPVPDDYTVPVDPSDEFYELHFDEANLVLSDLRSQRMELENRPLMTEAMRQRIVDDQKELKLKCYKKSVIRIQFPDRIVLQGVFGSDELIENVYDFVRSSLRDPDLRFYLYTSPPKLLLEPGKRLIDVDCVPLASIYFGLANRQAPILEFVRLDLVGRMTTYEIATAAAVVIRRSYEGDTDSWKTRRRTASSASAAASEEKGDDDPTQTDSPSTSNDRQSAGVVRTTPKSQPPKWFRPM